jgi:5-methylthioribose kinase
LNHVVSKYFEDALGFAGCELIRRTIGLAHVADLDRIEDENVRLTAKRKSLELGRLLIKQRKEIKGLTEFITAVKETIK